MAWTREQMAARAAKELRDGYYVNLGIGIPTLVSNYIPNGIDVNLQSENGMLGMGPFPYEDEVDADLIIAGVKRVVVVMEHSAKDGAKLLKRCNLPLTGERVVDMVVTDLAVFTIDKHGKDGMALIELADGVTLDEVKAKTEAEFRVALKNA